MPAVAQRKCGLQKDCGSRIASEGKFPTSESGEEARGTRLLVHVCTFPRLVPWCDPVPVMHSNRYTHKKNIQEKKIGNPCLFQILAVPRV